MQNCFAKPKDQRANSSSSNALDSAQRSEKASKGKKSFLSRFFNFGKKVSGKNKDKSGPF